MYYLLILAAFFFSSNSYATVENSIIPLIDKHETLEELSPHKYSREHFLDIEDALDFKDLHLRLVTYNMLFNLKDAELAPEYRWEQRLARIVELLDNIKPDIIAVQELVPMQLEQLVARLQDAFDFFEEHGIDKTTNAVFYRKERLKLLKTKKYPLTKASSALLSNALNVIKLRDRETDQDFFVMNTHLCFSDINIRETQAKRIVKVASKLGKKAGVILAGDFNTFTQCHDLPELPFYDGDRINRILTSDNLEDARFVSLLGHFGPSATFTNKPDSKEPFLGTGTPGVFLDHIFISKEIGVLMHAVEPATVNGYFASDHMPVIIDFFVYQMT